MYNSLMNSQFKRCSSNFLTELSLSLNKCSKFSQEMEKYPRVENKQTLYFIRFTNLIKSLIVTDEAAIRNFVKTQADKRVHKE